jgi:hypothetical protein
MITCTSALYYIGGMRPDERESAVIRSLEYEVLHGYFW